MIRARWEWDVRQQWAWDEKQREWQGEVAEAVRDKSGARVERLNWLADLSPKGLQQSAGMMINYLYKLSEIEENHERYTDDGRIAASPQLRSLLRS